MSYPEVLVKICGLTRARDAVACAELGVDWIGLNFHPPSPRYVDLETAAAIRAALPAQVKAAGVFVDRPTAEVLEIADRLELDAIQLHGAEPPEVIAALGRRRVIRAFRLADSRDWANVSDYLARAEACGRRPDHVLVDAYVAGQPGGTGTTIDVRLFDDRPAGLPPLVLAGGLHPGNVAGRARSVRPWMVDVASGVESAPGVKDRALVAAFLRALGRVR